MVDVAAVNSDRDCHCFKKEDINFLGPKGKFGGFAYAGLGMCRNDAKSNLPSVRARPSQGKDWCASLCRDSPTCVGFTLEQGQYGHVDNCHLNTCKENAPSGFNTDWNVDDWDGQASVLSVVADSSGGPATRWCYYKYNMEPALNAAEQDCAAVTQPPPTPYRFNYEGNGVCTASDGQGLPYHQVS